jgi:hypothetical protein
MFASSGTLKKGARRKKMNLGKAAMKAAASAIAAASVEVSSAAVDTGSNGAVDGAKNKKTIMIPTTVLDECSASGLKPIQCTKLKPLA